MRRLLSFILAGALVLTLAGTTLAAKGGTKGSGGTGSGRTAATISVPDGVFAGTTIAATAAGLWVKASCYQNGTLVYVDYELADSTGSAVLPLGPTMMWTSGAASCTADAGSINKGSFKAATSTTFDVSG